MEQHHQHGGGTISIAGTPLSRGGTRTLVDDTATRVAAAVMRLPKTCDQWTTVRDAQSAFADDHVYALLVTRGTQLLAVVERADLVGVAADRPIVGLGRLAGRVVGPTADLAATHRTMLATRRRRLAVVDGDGRLIGLLCLKRTGLGFCSDRDVAARADEANRP